MRWTSFVPRFARRITNIHQYSKDMLRTIGYRKKKKKKEKKKKEKTVHGTGSNGDLTGDQAGQGLGSGHAKDPLSMAYHSF